MTNHQPLRDKVAVITGGGRGIGYASPTCLAEMGARTVICGRSRQTRDDAAEKIRSTGSRCEAVTCDVSDWSSVEALAGRVQSAFGGTDVLVNNAGVGDFSRPLHELPADVWERIFNTN